MAEYNPSKIIKDGNTYNFRDTTKIPLSGTNALAGSIVPATDNSIDIGSSTSRIKLVYVHKIVTVNDLSLVHADNGGATIVSGGTDLTNASLELMGKDYSYLNRNGYFILQANDGTNLSTLEGTPSGTLTWGSKNVAMQEDTVPRSGGAVMTGTRISRDNNTSALSLDGGSGWEQGSTVVLYGKDNSGRIILAVNDGAAKYMALYPNGTWTWDGTACQIASDQRLKQQISDIDDKLLDAWEDVEPVQFKYNDAVEQKGKDNARLHTGYVVQQIDSACKSHNVDISNYGLYCHEEYPQETEEVEVEQADGTKTKEKKVIREASEHYSLRYTEALIVECAYLRKCIKELRTEIEQLKSSK